MKIYWNKLFEIKIDGIKCDNPSCNYIDKEVKKYNYHNYLNMPCPLCRENLLTKKDYELLNFMFCFKKLIGWIRYPSLKPPKVCEVDLKMNGTGVIKTGEIKLKS
jgi:hypothetical protein